MIDKAAIEPKTRRISAVSLLWCSVFDWQTKHWETPEIFRSWAWGRQSWALEPMSSCGGPLLLKNKAPPAHFEQKNKTPLGETCTPKKKQLTWAELELRPFLIQVFSLLVGWSCIPNISLLSDSLTLWLTLFVLFHFQQNFKLWLIWLKVSFTHYSHSVHYFHHLQATYIYSVTISHPQMTEISVVAILLLLLLVFEWWKTTTNRKQKHGPSNSRKALHSSFVLDTAATTTTSQGITVWTSKFADKHNQTER